MRPKLLLWCALAAALPPLVGLRAEAQSPDDSAAQAVPQVAPLPNYSQPAATQPQYGQRGDLDPNFGDNVTDKPHAGLPLQGSDGSQKTAPQAQQGYQTPQWYKDSPQAYDHAPQHHRLQRPRPQPQLSLKSDAEPPRNEIAQGPQEQMPAQPYADPAPQQSPYYPPQSAPQYYPPQPAPQYYPPQPAPQYYNQQPAPGYAAPPQQDDQQGQAYGQPPEDYDASGAAPSRPPLSAQDLEQLVAPIALYPDSLLAQILTAATYPAQISAANQWLRSMGNIGPDQIAAGADAQTSWDPSIKALTAFPQVLDMLAGNLQWTTALGNAYYNQPQDVLQTVQVLRDRAEQAGNLESTPQEQVTQQQGYVEIEPTNPEFVYVPTYNPWEVYGGSIAPYPGFNFFGALGSFVGAGVQFGLGFGIGPFMRMPFGLLAWGLDWLGNAILFHHNDYWTHSREVRDWGFAHGGRRWEGGGRGYYGGREMARYGDRFGSSYNHQAIAVHGNGFNGGGFGHVNGGPQRPYGGGEQGFGRGYEGTRPARPAQQAYNRMPSAVGRPQPYPGGSQSLMGRNEGPRPGAGYGGSIQNYGGRPGYGGPSQSWGGRQGLYAGGSQGYRPTPPSTFGRGGYGGEPGRGFAPGGYASQPRSEPRSGGFHWFGGGHSSSNFGGGNHSFGGSRSYGGGGHSFGGGGHSFGGGGHSFGGGGHSFGGGHGGGHSGGGHSGGHHR